MKVIDLNGKERKIKSAKLISHDAVDVVTGNTVPEKFVEVEIKGKQSTWTEWWPFKDFKRKNPTISLEG